MRPGGSAALGTCGRIAEELGAEWTTPEEALLAQVDVVAPCALGGILDHDSVPRLRCRAIAGAANNQLASDEIGDLLASRGIVWAPDFVANGYRNGVPMGAICGMRRRARRRAS